MNSRYQKKDSTVAIEVTPWIRQPLMQGYQIFCISKMQMECLLVPKQPAICPHRTTITIIINQDSLLSSQECRGSVLRRLIWLAHRSSTLRTLTSNTLLEQRIILRRAVVSQATHYLRAPKVHKLWSKASKTCKRCLKSRKTSFKNPLLDLRSILLNRAFSKTTRAFSRSSLAKTKFHLMWPHHRTIWLPHSCNSRLLSMQAAMVTRFLQQQSPQQHPLNTRKIRW